MINQIEYQNGFAKAVNVGRKEPAKMNIIGKKDDYILFFFGDEITVLTCLNVAKQEVVHVTRKTVILPTIEEILSNEKYEFIPYTGVLEERVMQALRQD